jgi:hypothetical protein
MFSARAFQAVIGAYFSPFETRFYLYGYHPSSPDFSVSPWPFRCPVAFMYPSTGYLSVSMKLIIHGLVFICSFPFYIFLSFLSFFGVIFIKDVKLL